MIYVCSCVKIVLRDFDFSLGTLGKLFYGSSLFPDADDIVQYLHLTRHTDGRLREVYGNVCFQAEPEPMWSWRGDGGRVLPPPSLFICDDMEVIGCVDEDDEVRVDLFIWVISPFFLFTKNMFIKLMQMYTGKLENGYWIFERKVNEYHWTI